ncbi:MAG: hypothetical protein HZB16_09380 [Armatimonadetes bacterium]|nr:hypothetical protein [Armatimonadota bacterium]
MNHLASMTLLLTALAAVPAAEPTFTELEALFRDQPMAARRHTGPLYWMHGDETQAQLERELDNVVEGHNGTFTAEPRPHRDWLGPGWYRDLDIALAYAKRSDLTMIIYDDYWWPSQMMGGRVPAKWGSKRLQSTELVIDGPRDIAEPGLGEENLVALIAGRVVEGDTIDADSLVDLTGALRDGVLHWQAPAGKWRLMRFFWRFNGNQGGQQRFISVDGASPDCVDWFLNTVYQPHYDRYKDDFGKTIVGYFYDEPETQGDWGSDLPKLIAERGLSLPRLLVGYRYKLAGEAQTAAFYTYLDCFAESWGRTMYGGMSRWCRAHGVVSMGHFMEHAGDLFSRGMSGGNMVQLQKYSDMGGMDLVVGQVHPGQRNMAFYQMPKLASSVSHVYHKADDIAFSETFGGYGQDLTYPEMKWLTDWQQVRGVNFMIPHSFNPRAPYDRDYPPYFANGGLEPRWPLYRVWADYTNRLSTMLTGGAHVAPVALLYIGQSVHVGRATRPEELTTALQDAQYDCDWLPYDAWEQDATLAASQIALHSERYRVLVVPPVEVIPYATLAKVRDFFAGGGVVVGYGFLPTRSATIGHDSAEITALREAIWGDARPSTAVCRTSAAGGRSYFLGAKPTPAELKAVLGGDAKVRPTLETVDGAVAPWLHVLHRRRAGRDVFLLCNQDHQATRTTSLRVTGDGEPELWDAMRGQATRPKFRRLDVGTVELDLTLEPSESTLLVFAPSRRDLRGTPGAGQPVPIVRQANPPAPAVDEQPHFPLADCSWVWFPESNAAQGAAVGPRYFRARLALPAERRVKAARFVLSADNEFTLYVNGAKVAERLGDGEAWRAPQTVDITKQLVAGANQLAIMAGNLPGTPPNPAGLIGRWKLEFEQGEPLTGAIDATWRAAATEQPGWTTAAYDDAGWAPAKVVAKHGDGPWGALDSSRRPFTLGSAKADPFEGRCELPADFDPAQSRVFLEVEDLAPEEAASVSLNGTYAGGFIGRPLRLEVTACAKPGANTVSILPFAPKSARLVLSKR